jgi:hypothetical protein
MNDMLIAVCTRCRNYRIRPEPELFGLSDLQTPGVLKSKLEWDQQNQERRLLEMQRFDAGQPFNYEPYHYPWCAAYTPYDNQLSGAIASALGHGDRERARQLAKESVARGVTLIRRAQAGDTAALQELAENGRATMNPVTGEVMQVYTLCARVNPTGQCPLFEP